LDEEEFQITMKEKPLVSVLTPSYNMSRYITSCIESVLAQDYDRVEHIIQDGVSQDDTIKILQRYSDRINWISEPDKGQSDGLNKALQRCQGDIIIVLNADDELLPQACSWAVEQMAKYPEAAVIYGDQYNINSQGRIMSQHFGPIPYDFEKIFCVEETIPAQAAFIKREALEKVGFFVDTTRKTCPDYEMWVRIGLKFPMKHVEGFICKYRIHPGSEQLKPGQYREFMNSKWEVIDRVVSDPQTPTDIRKLKKRAYSGLLVLTIIYMPMRSLKRIGYYLKAIFIYPHPLNVFRLLGQFMSWIYCLLKHLMLELARKRKQKN